MNAVPAPFRITLADYLTNAGRTEEAERSYRCACGRIVPAAGFVDVRDRPEGEFKAPWVCGVCVSHLQRVEAAEYEAAQVRAAEAEGLLHEETLNGLRATRDLFLARSDWTQLADNRERIGPELAAAWDAARAAARAWFATARDTGVIEDFPTTPE